VTDSQDIPQEPEYTLDDFQRFAKILGVPNLSPEHVKRLQRAALHYWFLAVFDMTRPKRSEYRKALERITVSAQELKAALEHRASMHVGDFKSLSSINTDVLDNLAEAAEETANHIPKSGANPKTARKRFVADLGDIYFAATSKHPTFSRNRHHEPSGQFFKFVEAALRPLNAHAIPGLEHDVRPVVKSMAKTPT
jgi:hypothetical protein